MTVILMTVVFIMFDNRLEKLLWTCRFWVSTHGQVTIYLNPLTKCIHIELRKPSNIHLTITSERIIEFEHNRSVQSIRRHGIYRLVHILKF